MAEPDGGHGVGGELVEEVSEGVFGVGVARGDGFEEGGGVAAEAGAEGAGAAFDACGGCVGVWSVGLVGVPGAHGDDSVDSRAAWT